MTIVADLLNLCLKDIGIVGEGQTASADSMADAFDTLKQMLGMWQADKLYVYASKEIAATLTGAASYTVGTGGVVNVPRPVKIDAAFWRSGGVDYPVEVLDSFVDYEAIAVKGQGGEIPSAICYVPSYPLGTLYVYPSTSAGALHMVARVDLPSYVDSFDDLALPPEYALAIRYSLDELLSISFQAPLRPDIPPMAAKARKIMKRNNVSIPLAQMPGALSRGYSDIRAIY